MGAVLRNRDLRQLQRDMVPPALAMLLINAWWLASILP